MFESFSGETSAGKEVRGDQNQREVGTGIFRSWLLPLEHGKAATLFLMAIGLCFAIGVVLGFILRLELLTPAGDLLPPGQYATAFSMHGLILIFFFFLPLIPSTLGNYLLPSLINARSMAFPRFVLFSWLSYAAGVLLILWVLLSGGIDASWQLDSQSGVVDGPGRLVPTAFALILLSLSLVLTGLNQSITLLKMRASGMKWGALGPFSWSLFATSLVFVLASPVFIMLLLLLLAEQVLGLPIFDSTRGGDPLLFSHLFWFFARPALYAGILPAIGVVSHVISARSGRKLAWETSVGFSMLAIAVLGFFSSGSHVALSSQSTALVMTSSLPVFLTAVPFGIILGSWIATLSRGVREVDGAVLCALCFILLLVEGGLTGLILAAAGLNVQLHSTTFVVGHFHLLAAGGVVLAFLGGMTFWLPAVTGRRTDGNLSRISPVLVFVAVNLTFLPLFLPSFAGLLRRSHEYPEEFQLFQIISSASSTILLIALILPFIHLLWTAKFGPAVQPEAAGSRSPD